jgi:hypothetical protein
MKDLCHRSCIADDGAGNITVVIIYNLKMDLIKPKDILYVADAKLKTVGLKEVLILQCINGVDEYKISDYT